VQDICVTFDNGPEPDATPLVLEVLARRRIGATFFPIGRKLAEPTRRALAERAASEGHRVGNHTWSHGAPLGMRGGAEAVAEITRAEAALGGLNRELLFRPNGGGGALGPHLLNRSALRALMAGGYTVVLWNAVPRDWDDADGWPARACAMAAAASAPVLMVLHDLDGRAMRYLDATLGRLADAGHRFTREFPEACIPLRAGALRCDAAAISGEDTAP
jgi:peptidoglycan-N-acetylglucosamine deacetylase